jgi:hypothetical protein
MNHPHRPTDALLWVSLALAFAALAPAVLAQAQTAQPPVRSDQAADKKTEQGEADKNPQAERSAERTGAEDTSDKPKRDKKGRKGEQDSERELEEEDDI